MNKISMDALNTGWNLGAGTVVRSRNADFEAAFARSADVGTEAAPRQPNAVAAFVADLLDWANATFRSARAVH